MNIYQVHTRRKFIKNMFYMAAGCTITQLFSKNIYAGEAIKETGKKPKKPLVVYFSISGNTASLARQIQKNTGADILAIETANPYPDKYDDLTKYAKEELAQKSKPALKNKMPNLDDYGLVFLGFPNWWSSMPMPVYTFIEQSKMNGKTIAPFVTHGGGGLGHIVEDLKKEAPKSKILKPLAISGSSVSRAEADVKKWLEGLGTALIETTTGNPAIYPDGAY